MSNEDELILKLTSPHAISFSRTESLTIDLAAGDLPVLAPEKAHNAPVSEITFCLVNGSAGRDYKPIS